MKLGVAEILTKASEITDRQERINWLRQNNSVLLESVLRGAYDKRIVWLLPEGEPPYKPNSLPDLQNVFYAECRKLYLFIEGGHKDLSQKKRETLFIAMLENLDKDDAKVLLAIKDKHLPFPGVDRELVQEAFPGILDE